MKKRRLENIAPLYTEDLGTEGIKRSIMATGTVLQSSNFLLPLTEDEEHRRRKRTVRLIQAAPPCISSTPGYSI
jgi:hypothetical protein